MFNKLIKRKAFNTWKRHWEIDIRDFKPYWLYDMAKKYSDLELSCLNKVVIKHKKNIKMMKKSSETMQKIIPDSFEEANGYFKSIEKIRNNIVKEDLDPLLKHQFQKEIKYTGKKYFKK